MTYDCRAIANLILDLAEEEGVRPTHMAVHKILYYGHAWHLALTGRPLVKQEFQAWKDGPVQRLVWDCFKQFGAKPVTARATRLDLVTRVRSEVREPIADAEVALLRQVVAGYGQIDAWELSRMTHEKGGPWDKVWNAPGGRVTPGMHIPNASIRAHFLGKRIVPRDVV